MKNVEIDDRVIGFLKDLQPGDIGISELRRALGFKKKDNKRLRNSLTRLVHSGTITRTKRNTYTMSQQLELVTGVLSVLRSGKGFVAPEDGSPDIFISRRDVGNALPEDIVRVQLFAGSTDAQPEGRIVQIVERQRRDIVATLRRQGRGWFGVPILQSYQKAFLITDVKDAVENDRVVIRVQDFDDDTIVPEGEIIEVIGPEDNPSLDTVAIMKQYGYLESFPDAVLKEAETAAFVVDQDRVDIRDKLIFTIDPKRARDFDDALSLERDSEGRQVIGVHIADVAHFVQPDSAMDKEAIRRGNSVYLPDKVIPMLPEQLSNGICSLRPDEDRFAFSVFMMVDGTGKVTKSWFQKTHIRSCLRLTYEQAMDAIEAATEGATHTDLVPRKVMKVLKALHKLSRKLRRNRFRQHALDLEIPEFDVVMGDEGLIESIIPSVHDESHQLIEEYMIAANEAVDRHLSGRHLDLIHRLHEAPDEDKIEELAIKLLEMGFTPGNLNNRKNMSKFLGSLDEHPLSYDAQVLVLRSMKRAMYSATEKGHYGLSKAFYAHFTSPIRRYADLVVHRILYADLTGTKPPYPRSWLERTASGISITEQRAAEAEREITEIKKYRFLAQQLEQQNMEVYDAVITKVARYGFFVELQTLRLYGLVHASTLPGKPVHSGRKRNVLRVGKHSYEIGQKVQVYVSGVDFEKRELDFVLADDV